MKFRSTKLRSAKFRFTTGGERRENGGVPERPVREGVDPERRSTLAALASGESAPRFYDTRPFLIGRSHFFPTVYGGGLSRLRLVRLP